MSEIELKVTDIQPLTDNIKMFEFRAADGGELPPFEAGAHLDFQVGDGLTRSYSLANDPAERDRYVTAVLKETKGGGGSVWMHENLEVGDVLKATEPINNFPLAEDAGEHLLLAGGIGITPLLAMGYVLRARKDAKYHLHYCTRSPEETAFMDEVKEVFGEHVTFHHDGGDPAQGIDLEATFGDRPEHAHLYVCGPAGLLRAARDATSHWPSGTVHFELFSSSRTDEERAEIAARKDEEFEVELAQSGMTLTVPADKSILDVLQDNGIDIVYVCEDGWCGTCQVPLLEGKADHRDEFLSDEEKAENSKIQVCISRAMPGEKLVLDI